MPTLSSNDFSAFTLVLSPNVFFYGERFPMPAELRRPVELDAAAEWRRRVCARLQEQFPGLQTALPLQEGGPGFVGGEQRRLLPGRAGFVHGPEDQQRTLHDIVDGAWTATEEAWNDLWREWNAALVPAAPPAPSRDEEVLVNFYGSLCRVEAGQRPGGEATLRLLYVNGPRTLTPQQPPVATTLCTGYARALHLPTGMGERDEMIVVSLEHDHAGMDVCLLESGAFRRAFSLAGGVSVLEITDQQLLASWRHTLAAAPPPASVLFPLVTGPAANPAPWLGATVRMTAVDEPATAAHRNPASVARAHRWAASALETVREQFPGVSVELAPAGSPLPGVDADAALRAPNDQTPFAVSVDGLGGQRKRTLLDGLAAAASVRVPLSNEELYAAARADFFAVAGKEILVTRVRGTNDALDRVDEVELDRPMRVRVRASERAGLDTEMRERNVLRSDWLIQVAADEEDRPELRGLRVWVCDGPRYHRDGAVQEGSMVAGENVRPPEETVSATDTSEEAEESMVFGI